LLQRLVTTLIFRWFGRNWLKSGDSYEIGPEIRPAFGELDVTRRAPCMSSRRSCQMCGQSPASRGPGPSSREVPSPSCRPFAGNCGHVSQKRHLGDERPRVIKLDGEATEHACSRCGSYTQVRLVQYA
jgi:hypothetical protein